jgi:hypothetical protein
MRSTIRTATVSARIEWWAGYIRGLRRAHHGERFRSDAEQALWLSAADSPDALRAALGRGYRAGLTMTAHDPDVSDT